jgi:DNA-binding phage protein
MTAYAQELRRCQVVLLLRAVINARGNMCAAAKNTGVHRNTIFRILHGAGYNSARLKQLARVHNLAFRQESAEEERKAA